jgi:hypothetical protein
MKQATAIPMVTKAAKKEGRKEGRTMGVVCSCGVYKILYDHPKIPNRVGYTLDIY